MLQILRVKLLRYRESIGTRAHRLRHIIIIIIIVISATLGLIGVLGFRGPGSGVFAGSGEGGHAQVASHVAGQ